MKKIYLDLSTLIFLSILFTLASCTTDAIGDAAAKNETPYYNARIGDTVPVTRSLSTYASTADGNEAVDPDWKKLITHFIGSTGSNE